MGRGGDVGMARGEGEMGRGGDAETRRHGDTETRRRGDTETRRRGDEQKNLYVSFLSKLNNLFLGVT
ncbi:MAG: hypothetical protein F6K58_09730 [Symploca sp. SIO2E9]|nr:hypothetical protein [Symploca sp. SIO2E9]